MQIHPRCISPLVGEMYLNKTWQCCHLTFSTDCLLSRRSNDHVSRTRVWRSDWMADTDKAFKSIRFTMLYFHGSNGTMSTFRVKNLMCESINLWIKSTRIPSQKAHSKGRKEEDGFPPRINLRLWNQLMFSVCFFFFLFALSSFLWQLEIVRNRSLYCQEIKKKKLWLPLS